MVVVLVVRLVVVAVETLVIVTVLAVFATVSLLAKVELSIVVEGVTAYLQKHILFIFIKKRNLISVCINSSKSVIFGLIESTF